MLIAFALYGGMFHGMEPAYETFFRAVSLLVTVPAVIWGGGIFIAGAWSALTPPRSSASARKPSTGISPCAW